MCDHKVDINASQLFDLPGSVWIRWFQGIHLHLNFTFLPLEVKRENNFELFVWNSWAVIDQTVVQIQIWLFSLRTVNSRNHCRIGEACFHEVFHFIFIYELVLFSCFQSYKHVVYLCVYRTLNRNVYEFSYFLRDLFLAFRSASIAINVFRVITSFAAFQSTVSTNCGSILSADTWTTLTNVEIFNDASRWVTISIDCIFVVTGLSND